MRECFFLFYDDKVKNLFTIDISVPFPDHAHVYYVLKTYSNLPNDVWFWNLAHSKIEKIQKKKKIRKKKKLLVPHLCLFCKWILSISAASKTMTQVWISVCLPNLVDVTSWQGF